MQTNSSFLFCVCLSQRGRYFWVKFIRMPKKKQKLVRLQLTVLLYSDKARFFNQSEPTLYPNFIIIKKLRNQQVFYYVKLAFLLADHMRIFFIAKCSKGFLRLKFKSISLWRNNGLVRNVLVSDGHCRTSVPLGVPPLLLSQLTSQQTRSLYLWKQSVSEHTSSQLQVGRG